MNKVILIGNLTKDIEKETSSGGKTYVKFNVAVQRRFKNPDGVYDTDFFNCIAWNSTADFLGKYCKKGNKIALVGRMETFTYDDQQGNSKKGVRVVCDEVELAQRKETTEEPATQPELTPIDDDDSLPF